MAVIEDPEEHELAALRECAPPFAGARVLEIGCGSGRLTEEYAAEAASVVAIDPDADAIDELREYLPHVETHAVGIEGLTLPPRTIDVVLFAWSL
jgi:16S rRNA A1518/A1519 N6-dimethyltransferase RsmA/KsgA/DIM1 with predicted DNA glycosylase/AP lyase activity